MLNKDAAIKEYQGLLQTATQQISRFAVQLAESQRLRDAADRRYRTLLESKLCADRDLLEGWHQAVRDRDQAREHVKQLEMVLRSVLGLPEDAQLTITATEIDRKVRK